jgi:3-dehydroquinate dehydratase-1
MRGRSSVKKQPPDPRIVGVIASRADLRSATQMPRMANLFELRLDHLCKIVDEVEDQLSILRAPLIITARHPKEGGANNLSIEQRRELLSRFLPRVDYIDLELRSANAFRSLIDVARRKNVRRIISFHDFNSTPAPRILRAKARAAKSWGADIFKVATRTDTPDQLARLLQFFANKDVAEPAIGGQLLQLQSRARLGERNRRSWATQPIDPIGCPPGAKRVDLAVSAMGIGKLGAVSRLLLAQCGSALNYVSLGRSQIEGQLSIKQLRSALDQFKIAPGRNRK